MTFRVSLIAAILLFSTAAAQAKESEQKSMPCPQTCSCKHDQHAAAPVPNASVTARPAGMTLEDLEHMRNSP